MSGEVHVLPAAELERIKREEYFRGWRDAHRNRAKAQKAFGKRVKPPGPTQGT